MRSPGGRRRVRWVAVVVGFAVLAAVAVRQARNDALAPNEAIAVIPMMDGIGEGTPVRVRGIGQPIGQVTQAVRRADDFVLRIRFNQEAGIERRRGDGITIWGTRDEKSVMIVRAPSYEKQRTPSDTLRAIRPGERRPASVHALLAGLYRGAPGPDSARRR